MGFCQAGKHRKPGTRLLVGLTVVLTLAAAAGGCTRKFYRQQADRQVEFLLNQKDQDPRWAIEQYHVYPDPRARFGDPTRPDHPPMPPDDPAAAELSPHTQNKEIEKVGIKYIEGSGYLDILAQWDAQNRAQKTAEDQSANDASSYGGAADKEKQNTSASSSTGSALVAQATTTPIEYSASSPKPFLITLEQSVEMGLINSREFQDRREDLFLAALPVSVQRFAFSAQPWLTEVARRERLGNQTPEGYHNRWTFDTNHGFGELFSTGALLLLNFANRTVIELTNFPRHTISESTLSLDIVQPFLLGGGKAVTMEPLTQVERNLLYFIRTFAHFRKEFFVSIAGGGGISGGAFVPTGVISSTTVTPAAGVGSSGIIPGVIPPVIGDVNTLAVSPGVSGRINLGAAIPASPAGFLGTLQEYVQIDIDRRNIVKLQEIIQILEGFVESGDVSPLQVQQAEQQLLRGRTTLLTDQQQYLDAIDRFKLQLGLPMNVYLELDDAEVRPLIQHFRRYEEVIGQFDEASKRASGLSEAPVGAGRVRQVLKELATTSRIVQGTRFRSEFPSRWAEWERISDNELKARLEKLSQQRRKLLDLKTDAEKGGVNLPRFDQQRLDEVERQRDLGFLELTLRQYDAEPWKNEPDARKRRQAQVTAVRQIASVFVLLLGEARNERLEQINRSWPEVPALCLEDVDLLTAEYDEALARAARTALANRLDLMNVRGQLVDAWRQVAIFANALLGTFNVRYHMETFSPLGLAQPLALGSGRTRNVLALDAEPPLIRRVERNNYRATLIAYQRQRRAFMEAEDLVVQGVRGQLRSLRVLAENYKIQQRQVELAYLTVENSLDVFAQPPQPTPVGGPAGGASQASQAAALTNQLLQAQASVPTAQVGILSVWINYLNTRMQFYRDLELMPLDFRGVWNDEHATCCRKSSTQSNGAAGPGQRPNERRSPDGDGGDPLPLPRPLEPRPTGPTLPPP